MDAVPETEMASGVSVKIESTGIGEHIRIVIGGRDRSDHAFVCRYVHPSDVDFIDRHPQRGEMSDAQVPKELFSGVVDESRIVAERLPLIVMQEHHHGERDHVGGRVKAGGEEEVEHVHEF